jgi:hypothetical protein
MSIGISPAWDGSQVYSEVESSESSPLNSSYDSSDEEELILHTTDDK